MEELSINGGRPAKRKPYPEWPAFDEREISSVVDVIKSRKWWRMVGEQVTEFEREFAAYHNARAAVAVTNGTQAIEVALAALGVEHGDEVIVPAYSFISTATAVLGAGAVPVFVDILPDSYCLDPSKLEAAITPRTKAIIPVHMAGHVADMDAIIEVADRHGLPVVEDAAHAHGAEWRGKRVGALHRGGGIFSFQAGKLMTAGEGGLVMSNDEEFIERCFLYGNCGRPRTDRTYQHTVLGSNCRMSELHAAVLRAQMDRLDEQIAVREANARLLDDAMRRVPGVEPQGHDPRVNRHPHYMYMFRYDEAEFGGLSRMDFVDALIAEGVPAFVGYPAMYRTPVFINRAFGARWNPADPLLPDYSQTSCPVAERVGDTVVWFHHRVLLGDEQDVRETADAVEKVRAHARRAVGAAS
ncbi:MAG TPA: DegT/DnrJ/EryC1/StrS family aminotransferase [Pyrinomonadaceae bacterium]|jgi:3-amino-5-hydroxybenzoate synthase